MTKLSKKKKKFSPFIAGVIAAGLTCALYSVIFPFYRIGDYVMWLAAALAVVILFVFIFV